MSDGTAYPDFDWHQRWKESQDQIAILQAELAELREAAKAVIRNRRATEPGWSLGGVYAALERALLPEEGK